MSELANNIARYLNIKIDPRQTSFYRLLGLRDGESDSAQIGAALKRAFDRLKASKTTADPQGWDQVARLIQQVQRVLLDPAKKAAYDQKLQSAVRGAEKARESKSDTPQENQKASNGKVSQTPVAMEKETDRKSEAVVIDREPAPTVVGLLPSGDPHEPFDFPRFVRGHSTALVESESVEDRLTALKFLLQKEVHRGVGESERRIGETPNRIVLPKSPSLTQRTRVRQRLSLSSGLLTIIMLLGAGGVVVFGWWMVQNPRKQAVSQNAPPQKAPPKPTDVSPPPQEAKPPGSTLPSLGSGVDEERAARVRAMLASGAQEIQQQAAAKAAENTPADVPMKMEAETTMATVPDPTMMTEPNPAVNVPVETKPAELTDDEKQTLAASLTAARDSIAKQDFATFHREMEKSLLLARSEEGAKKYRRLNQLGLLHEQFVEALREGTKRLKSGSEIKVGSSIVIVVEIKADAIVVKDRGKSLEHALSQLPVALALGIADLALDKEKPVDVAARGVFCLVHPTRTVLNERQGKKFIEQAISSEEIHDDLLEALTDTY